MKGEKGFALVITVVITALLVALLVEFVNQVYVDTSHSHNFVASQQAGMLAESGIEGGIKLLQFDMATHPDYTSFLDLWAKPQRYDAGSGTVTITIEEESGKLDLNSATSQTGIPVDFYHNAAVRLFLKLGLPADLYPSLWDWVDTDDTPRGGGAESSYYGSLKPPYAAKNDKLATVEELGLIKGFTPEVLKKLRSSVTVYGPGGMASPININTAPPELLAALNDKLMNGNQVEQILEYRKTKPIKSLSDLNTLGLGPVLTSLYTYVTTKGSVYRIHSEGKVGESVSVVEAVVRFSGSQCAICYWREY